MSQHDTVFKFRRNQIIHHAKLIHTYVGRILLDAPNHAESANLRQLSNRSKRFVSLPILADAVFRYVEWLGVSVGNLPFPTRLD